VEYDLSVRFLDSRLLGNDGVGYRLIAHSVLVAVDTDCEGRQSMNSGPSGRAAPDKKLAAVCGLFCPACNLFIGTTEDPARLQKMAGRFRMTAEEVKCYGCRADKRGPYCDKYCKMTKCAVEKGIDFCGECPEYPCTELKTFQAQAPHRLELWESLARIKEVGYERWYAEMIERYSCPKCRTINSAYDMACRKCGATPSCEYVRQHRSDIARMTGNVGS
jgi:hypothetical protein